jgi:iron(III) transport system permease protein
LGLQKIPAAWRKSLLTLTTVGYAFPGAVLGLGILIPLATFDNWLADLVFATFRRDPGLLLTGSAGALIVAYCVRFFAIGVGAAEAGLAAISTNIPLAASTLGRGAKDVLVNIYQPLMRGSLASAMVLVFVDTVKELPATLLLRPTGAETLATRMWSATEELAYAQAAPYALVLVIIAGLPALALNASVRKTYSEVNDA